MGKREKKREKLIVPHFVTLVKGYMGVQYTILATFLKVWNFKNYYTAE